jgi:hypothetical protein
MALTKATYSLIDGAPYNVLDYGAVGNGIANDTAAIQSAINAIFAAGGGTLFFPAGTYLVSTLALNWGTAATSIIFRGAGKNATTIAKTGASTDPVLNFSATLSDGSYSEFCDFKVTANSTCDAFSITNIARCVWRNIRVDGGDAGIENKGSLINSFYDCDILNCTVGYRSRKANGIYCNLIEFFGGSVRGNDDWGFDIGDASGIHLYGTDIEANGTSGGTGGGLITRSTCDDETGYSLISINGAWFEGNDGTSVYAEACAGLDLSISDTPIINSESGAAVTTEAIGSLTLDRVVAASSGDTVNTSAARFACRQSTINNLSDSSTAHILENVTTGTGTTQFSLRNASGSFVTNGDAVRSKTGGVSVPNATATTIFSVSGLSGMYEVFATLDAGGVNYMSSALIGYDGTTPLRLTGTNSANLSITVSGSNVQVTQTSGSTQDIRYYALKIGR